MSACLAVREEEVRDAIVPHGYVSSGARRMAEAFNAGHRYCAKVMATGSGKSLLDVLVASILLRDGLISHAVICSPTWLILCGFSDYSGKIVLHDGVEIQIPEIRFLSGSTDLEKHLMAHDPGQIVLCTQALLTKNLAMMQRVFSLRDASRKLLIPDECHHCGADGLGAVISSWERHGGLLFPGTATPSRSDGRISVRQDLPDEAVFRRSLSQQMHEGYAPSRVLSNLVEVGGEEDAVEDYVMMPADIDASVKSMIGRWIRDGRPKTTIWIRNSGSREENARRVGQVLEGFRATVSDPSRIVDATDLESSSASLLKDVFYGPDGERNLRDYSDSRVDVVVGMQRIGEGFDWPLCSNVYILGIPRSYSALIQFLGRATRLKTKFAGYPAEWIDRSQIVLFVSSLKNASEAHSRVTLMSASMLSHYDVGQSWSALHDLWKLAADGSGRRGERIPKAVVEPDDEIRAKILEHLVLARAELSGPHDSAPTVRQALKRVKETMEAEGESLPEGVVDAVVFDEFGRADARIRQRYSDALRKALSGGADGPDAYKAAIDSVLKEFKDETIDRLPSSELVCSQLHSLNGTTIDKYAAKIRRTSTPLDDETIWNRCLKYRQSHGRFPSPDDGQDPSYPYETFAGYDHAFRNGLRSLPRTEGGLSGYLHSRYWTLAANGRCWVKAFVHAKALVGEKNRRAGPVNGWKEMDVDSYLVDRGQETPGFSWYPRAAEAAMTLGENFVRRIGVVKAHSLGSMSKKDMVVRAKEEYGWEEFAKV